MFGFSQALLESSFGGGGLYVIFLLTCWDLVVDIQHHILVDIIEG